MITEAIHSTPRSAAAVMSRFRRSALTHDGAGWARADRGAGWAKATDGAGWARVDRGAGWARTL